MQYTGTNVFIVNVALYTSTNSVLEQTEEKKISLRAKYAFFFFYVTHKCIFAYITYCHKELRIL